MSRKKKTFIFTDVDLDGAMSYLLFLWFRKSHIPYITTRVNDFGGSFGGWLKYHDQNDYDNVYILDLDVSDHIDLVDHKNVVIIDHHDSHVRNKHKYKKQWRWACGYRDALLFAKIVWPYAQVKLHKLEQIIDHYEPRAQELGDNVVDLETERQIRNFDWNIHGS